MKQNKYYEEYLTELPEGLIKATGGILTRYRGAERSVSRTWLVMMVAATVRFEYHNERDFSNFDRRVRRAIEILRASGWLIGSTVSGDGYYLIQTWQEYDEFRASYTSAAYKVMETARSMDVFARKQLGDPEAALQPALIGEE